MYPCIESLPDGKRIPFKCVNGGTSGSFVIKVLVFEKCFRSRENVYQCGRDSHLRGRFVRYPSVSLSPTLSRNEKVEQYIRKNTHKSNVLRFWVEDNVIPLYVSSNFILVRSPQLCLLEFFKKVLFGHFIILKVLFGHFIILLKNVI